MTDSEKREALLELAQLRKSCRLDGYCSIGDFHDGIFECGHISPWTKSGSNLNAEIMIVGQDWLGSDKLEEAPPDHHVVKYGFDPKFPTNANLDCLLQRHFGVKRVECYLTNVFPYIKGGDASVEIRLGDLKKCAKRFTLCEIQIVSPRLVICLGLATFNALRKAVGLGVLLLSEAIDSHFEFAGAMIHCVAHTGGWGMNNRGRDQVELDWQHLAAKFSARN